MWSNSLCNFYVGQISLETLVIASNVDVAVCNDNWNILLGLTSDCGIGEDTYNWSMISAEVGDLLDGEGLSTGEESWSSVN